MKIEVLLVEGRPRSRNTILILHISNKDSCGAGLSVAFIDPLLNGGTVTTN